MSSDVIESSSENKPRTVLKGWGRPDDLASPVEPAYLRQARDYLSCRGIAFEQFEAAGGEVVPSARAIDAGYPFAPALVFHFKHPLTGEPMTWTDAQGVTRPFHRVRPFRDGGPKFLQPRDSGTHVYFARADDWPSILADPSCGVVISEGETRSLAGAACDLPVISITGVDCGQVGGQLHPDLAVATWRGRQAFLAFDSDASRKPDVRRALERLAGLLHAEGAEVFETALPHAPDGRVQGLDDYLADHGVEAFHALLSSPETRPVAGLEAYAPPVMLAALMAGDYPPTEWAWDQFVLKGEVNLLYGDGGAGKSLLALYLAGAVAGGVPLFGSRTQQMPVLALFAEDGPAQVQHRASIVLSELSLSGDLPIMLWCQPSGDTLLATIDDNGVVTEQPRLHMVRAELDSCGAPALVVLDSLADLFAMNESLRLPVNAALKRVLGGLCRDYGATVVILAHPSKASMSDGTHYSGSTAFNNGVRQRLTLEITKPETWEILTEGSPLPRVLRVDKSNYGAQGEKRLWYYGATIMNLQAPQAAEAVSDAFHRACVKGAIESARRNLPCNRTHVPEPVYQDAMKVLGRRPMQKEILRELELATVNSELIWLPGGNRRAAGFYPPDHEEAVALAVATKKQVRIEKVIAPLSRGRQV